MAEGIKDAPAKPLTLDPLVSEARRLLCREVGNLTLSKLAAFPDHLRNDNTMAEMHLAVIWQMTHALVAADIANIDSCRAACTMGIHDGIRMNADLREMAKPPAGSA